jgi:tetratricopeptide (TPR) repeat protein
MSDSSIKEELQQIDGLIKQGKRPQALALIETARKSKPSTAHALELARLAHRNSAYMLSLRILYPQIESDREGQTQASPDVLAAYANSLINIGALEEAKTCTAKVRLHDDTLFVRALIDFAQWNYADAIPKLLDFLKSKKIAPYRRLVGKVNLASAYISTQNLEKAQALLDQVIAALTEDPNGLLLLGNCLELYSQIEIQTKNFVEARNKLQRAHDILASFHGRYLLYVKKWNSILDLTENPKNSSPLLKVRAEAQSLRNWETLRDCDYHLAWITQNQELLNRVYWGTPYKSFRQRLEGTPNVQISASKKLEFLPDDLLQNPQHIAWDIQGTSRLSKSGVTVSALVQTLMKDIYKPPRMGLIFSALYPKEHFNPFTSAPRVRNTVFRFNEWTAEEGIPFKLVIERGDFRLYGSTGSGIRTISSLGTKTKSNLQLREFRKQFGSKSFSSKDVAAVLCISVRSANSLIKEGCEKKVLKKVSASRSSRFLFSSHRSK